MDEPPRPRSRRIGNSGHRTLADHLDDLSARSTLDEFRRFLDLRPERWREFREALHKLVRDTSSWPEVQQDEHERSVCAHDLLGEVGFKYWGTEANRERNLLAEHVSSGSCCVYPRDEDLMAKAITMLLEKDSKARRESDANARESMAPRASVPPSPGLVSAVPVVPAAFATPTRPASNANGRPPSTPRRENAPRISEAARQTARPPVQPSAPTDAETAAQNMTILSHNFLATYFLLEDEDGDGDSPPICVSFNNYPDASAFIDAMAKICGTDDSVAQIAQEMSDIGAPIYRHQYALVHLEWSNITFKVRRDSGDWQSLVDRVGCAWTAKRNGELKTVEFKISVKLKYR